MASSVGYRPAWPALAGGLCAGRPEPAEGEGGAATVLVELGADLGRVRQAVMQVMSGNPVSSDVAFPESANSEPRCPQCRTALNEAAVSRSLAVASEDAGAESVLLDVVYCVHCGRSLHMFRSGEAGTGT